jgi:hypothetical protein
MPATAGPTTRAVLKIDALIAIALGRSSRDHVDRTPAGPAGRTRPTTPSAQAAPRRSALSPAACRDTLSARASSMAAACVSTMKRHLSMRSTTAPASGESSSAGE